MLVHGYQEYFDSLLAARKVLEAEAQKGQGMAPNSLGFLFCHPLIMALYAEDSARRMLFSVLSIQHDLPKCENQDLSS